MKVQLEGSSVLITGASSGIGEQFARQLAPRVRALGLVARRTERLEEIKRDLQSRNPKLKVELFSTDLSEEKDREKLFAEVKERLGEVDVLINNAGMGDIEFLNNTQWDKIHKMIRVNITALTHLTHQFAPEMARRKKGGILMVSSLAGFQSMPSFGAYSATKFFVRGLSDALRAELALDGVVVSALCPGPVKTEFGGIANKEAVKDVPGFVEISAESCAAYALRKFESGRAVIVPGVLAKTVYVLQWLMPEFVHRTARVWIARGIRAHLARS